MMNVTVLGASGFIGKHLMAALRSRGDQVRAISLRDSQAAAAAAATSDAIVNLAGEPLAQRWNGAVKERIERSRSEQPQQFLEALANLPRQVKTYVSASAVGYYGTSETRTFTEESPPGDDFLAHVCVRWEATAKHAQDLGMRVAVVRTGVALGNDGGALAKILPPFRLGAGGVVGSGRQWFPWVHIDDLVAIYLLALDQIDGPINATAPGAVTNAVFMQTLGSVLHRPVVLPVPTFALRAMLGEGADMLLTGQRVVPERALTLGYMFRFPQLEGALQNLLHAGE